MVKLSFISLWYIYGTERNIFTNKKFETIYVRSILYEKMEFYKNVKFGLVALASHYGSCFNASLSRYNLQIYFVFKKLILRN